MLSVGYGRAGGPACVSMTALVRSFHPGGLQFALCDGSVRFVSKSVDMNLLADTASIAGSEVAQLPQ